MIQNNVASGIFDRIAGQVQLFKAAITSGVNVGTPFYPRLFRGVGAYSADGDYSAENDLISSTHGIDVANISGTMLKNLYTTFMNAIEAHALNNNALSFNSWLDISGINVHAQFEDAWYQSKGSHLNGCNVMFPDANINVATYTVITSGAGTYASLNPVGAGTGAVSSTNHAATKFLLVPAQSVISGIQINLRLLKEAGQSSGTLADSANIAFTSGSPNSISGIQIPVNFVNILSGNYYLDCNNIVATGGYQNDVYKVIAVRERDVTL